MKIVAIWAEDKNHVLGDGKGMCWNVPADFRHFKEQTLGGVVIMGRASYEALGKALPNRHNIVLTRQVDYTLSDAQVVHSLAEAISEGKKYAEANMLDKVWIAGGGQVYEQFMDYCDELLVSHLDLVATCEIENVYAPKIDEQFWKADPSRTVEHEGSGDAASWTVKCYVRRS